MEKLKVTLSLIFLPMLVRVLVRSMLFPVEALYSKRFWFATILLATHCFHRDSVVSHVSKYYKYSSFAPCVFSPLFLSHYVWLAPELREVVQPSVPSPVGHRRQRGGLVRLEARHPLHGEICQPFDVHHRLRWHDREGELFDTKGNVVVSFRSFKFIV